MLLRWKQPFGHYRVGHPLSSPTARIPKSQAMSSQTLWKGRKLAPSSLKWNLQVQSRGKNIFPTFCICVFEFDACILTHPGPTVEQQTEMARHAGRTLASLHPEQVSFLLISMVSSRGLLKVPWDNQIHVGMGGFNFTVGGSRQSKRKLVGLASKKSTKDVENKIKIKCDEIWCFWVYSHCSK